VLTALMPVMAGFLLGWVVEAMVGAFPLPILGGAIGPSGSPRVRGVFIIGLVVMWGMLMLTVFDASNEVYDGLGESTCALRAAGDSGSIAPQLNPGVPLATDASNLQSASAQAACVAAWQADDQARTIRVVLGELALHLSALFAWSVLAGAGLVMLAVLCVPVVGLAVIAAATRLIARLIIALGALAEMLLGLVHAVGVLLVRLLCWAGIPIPSAESMPSPANDHSVEAVAVAHSDAASAVVVQQGVNGTGHHSLT
jgi:hypothetical protein